ncbi:MAG: 5-oxoprolinase subunit C family protein [Ostreibacterium sp.]
MSVLFVIEKLALMVQYQDLGRFGYLHQGFSHSGAMDETAFAINNRLLGNDENAPQLEIALGGLQLSVIADCTIAISGAYLKPMLNNKPLVNFATCRVLQGDILSFGFAQSGQYLYLAVSGGFTVSPFLGSCSTTKRLNIAPGGALQIGDLLSGGTGLGIKLHGEPRHCLSDFQHNIIEVIPAYQHPAFSAESRQHFISQAFTIQASDRMGTRLSANTPISWTKGELLSEGIVPGAVQILPDGNPIVLQKDAQSIGGYPKIGVVPSASRSLLAQMPVGRKVWFQFV